VHVGDGEQVLENPLETHVFAIVSGGIQLQQRIKRARLNVEEMRHRHPLREFSE
jgi:hypothetical protein